MAAARKKVGRPKAKAPWSSSMAFRPYIQVDYHSDPGIHCLFFDNPDGLNDLIKRGLELAMAEQNLEYLNQDFQRQFVSKATGIFAENEKQVVIKRDVSPTRPVQDVPHLSPEPVTKPLPALNEQKTQTMASFRDESPPNKKEYESPALPATPSIPAGVSSFLAKAIADGA